ncbi:hypothetical protein DID75_02525 [Candidatus Marinamargulisbacteria bacterium SCGC AG-410-N11]|nr:hypothetical protein DID75_02525 [Candidatus Marinamargulisbacteria bacterium SCGC AG-410-N11]
MSSRKPISSAGQPSSVKRSSPRSKRRISTECRETSIESANRLQGSTGNSEVIYSPEDTYGTTFTNQFKGLDKNKNKFLQGDDNSQSRLIQAFKQKQGSCSQKDLANKLQSNWDSAVDTSTKAKELVVRLQDLQAGLNRISKDINIFQTLKQNNLDIDNLVTQLESLKATAKDTKNAFTKTDGTQGSQKEWLDKWISCLKGIQTKPSVKVEVGKILGIDIPNREPENTMPPAPVTSSSTQRTAVGTPRQSPSSSEGNRLSVDQTRQPVTPPNPVVVSSVSASPSPSPSPSSVFDSHSLNSIQRISNLEPKSDLTSELYTEALGQSAGIIMGGRCSVTQEHDAVTFNFHNQVFHSLCGRLIPALGGVNDETLTGLTNSNGLHKFVRDPHASHISGNYVAKWNGEFAELKPQVITLGKANNSKINDPTQEEGKVHIPSTALNSLKAVNEALLTQCFKEICMSCQNRKYYDEMQKTNYSEASGDTKYEAFDEKEEGDFATLRHPTTGHGASRFRAYLQRRNVDDGNIFENLHLNGNQIVMDFKDPQSRDQVTKFLIHHKINSDSLKFVENSNQLVIDDFQSVLRQLQQKRVEFVGGIVVDQEGNIQMAKHHATQGYASGGGHASDPWDEVGYAFDAFDELGVFGVASDKIHEFSRADRTGLAMVYLKDCPAVKLKKQDCARDEFDVNTIEFFGKDNLVGTTLRGVQCDSLRKYFAFECAKINEYLSRKNLNASLTFNFEAPRNTDATGNNVTTCEFNLTVNDTDIKLPKMIGYYAQDFSRLDEFLSSSSVDTAGGGSAADSSSSSTVLQVRSPKGSGEVKYESSETQSFDYRYDPITGHLTDSSGNDIGDFSVPQTSNQPIQNLASYSHSPCLKLESSMITDEIQNEENAGAIFMLPSQLNGAEYPSQNNVVTTMDAYNSDPTGGPRGQQSVYPGVGQFIIDNAENETSGGKGINAIRDVLVQLNNGLSANPFILQNGYLTVPKGLSEQERTAAIERLKANSHLLNILSMDNVPVAGGVSDGTKTNFSTKSHKVSMRYASAIPVATYQNDTTEPDEIKFQQDVNKEIILAQVYGILRNAAANPKTNPQKVFLMPLGTGAFTNNSQESFRDYIQTVNLAISKLTPNEISKLDVRILGFKDSTFEMGCLRQNMSKLSICQDQPVSLASHTVGVGSPVLTAAAARKGAPSTHSRSIDLPVPITINQSTAEVEIERLRSDQLAAYRTASQKFTLRISNDFFKNRDGKMAGVFQDPAGSAISKSGSGKRVSPTGQGLSGVIYNEMRGLDSLPHVNEFPPGSSWFNTKDFQDDRYILHTHSHSINNETNAVDKLAGSYLNALESYHEQFKDKATKPDLHLCCLSASIYGGGYALAHKSKYGGDNGHIHPSFSQIALSKAIAQFTDRYGAQLPKIDLFYYFDESKLGKVKLASDATKFKAKLSAST